MTQPERNHDSLGPPGKAAEIIPFKARSGEGLEPSELSSAECVTAYLHKWNEQSRTDGPAAIAINDDTDMGSTPDKWQQRLQEAIRKSPMYDHYDAIRDSDPIILLIESTIRSSTELVAERKALRTLLDVRAAEIAGDPDEDLERQLEQLPVGSEDLWLALIERLAQGE